MGKLLKKGDGDEDSKRLALFGSRSKSKSPAPPQNPYAQPTVAPDPYTQAKANAGIISRPGQLMDRGPPPSQGGYGGMGPLPERQGDYGRDSRYGPPQGGYGGDKRYGQPPQNPYGGDNKSGPPPDRNQDRFAPNPYGNRSGYGSAPNGGNPYASVTQPSGTSRYGPGGYGGLGRTSSNETTATDENRDALFGGARERYEQRQQQGPPGYAYNSSQPAGDDRSYGAYGDRQLTAEEEEEEDITATKQEIKFMKQQDVSSTRNALRMAQEAEESGKATLARLGAQGEQILNTEKNLDLAANHNRMAEEKARELKTLNRSMFAVHVNNPFTNKERQARRDEEIMDRHRQERDQREATRQEAFQNTSRMNKHFRDIDGQAAGERKQKSLAERAKFQFEADSEDDAMEDEIDGNIELLSQAAGRLNRIAKATGEEVETQVKHLERIAMKSDRVDDQLHVNTERLKRIH